MMRCFTREYQHLATKLLAINTISPMETGRTSDIAQAQRVYTAAAERLGFEVVYYEPPCAAVLADPCMPVSVHERSEAMGDAFWNTQPNLVLRLGPERKQDRTVMFNFHMDTVDGVVPTQCDGTRMIGRGVADAKGLGVAVLAGVHRATTSLRDFGKTTTVLIQSVAGEEGGAMGVYGTRVLINKGFIGRLNIVCEPTGGAYFDRTTASMTARIEVNGRGATDDNPVAGDNASILLASLTDTFAQDLAPRILALGAKMCISGLNTGSAHNRVYGNGTLLVNFAYLSANMGSEIERLVCEAFEEALKRFRRLYRENALAQFAASHAGDICKLTWLKRWLPVLSNRSPEMEVILAAAGVTRHDRRSNSKPFTCDAMWFQDSPGFAVVLGPGDLAKNNAHAAGEFLQLADLDKFACQVSSILHTFASKGRLPVTMEPKKAIQKSETCGC